MTVPTKKLTLDSLLDDNSPIYVRNVHEPRGIIVITLLNRSGKADREIIPNTKLPINLNDHTTPDTLRNSPDLRRLLSRHILNLVDPKTAELELRSEEAQEELLQAYRDALGDRDAIDKARSPEKKDINVFLKDDIVMGGEEDEGKSKRKDTIDVLEDEDFIGVNPKVKTIIAELGTQEMTARTAKNKLNSLNLNYRDLSYIIEEADATLVTKFAKKQLADLTTEDGENTSIE